MAVARDPLYRDFGPTLFAEHLERTFGVRVSVETLRNWMLEDGVWERRAALGELGQWDSSVHRWLEDRAGECVLISIHDDATSRLMMTRFVERATAERRTGRRLSGICAATAAPWPSTPTMPGTSDSGCRGRRSGRTRSSRGGSTCWASR